MKGIFLSIEGIEGVGKSTAVQFIQAFLISKFINVIITREPGGTGIAEQIRTVLLTPNNQEEMTSEAELLLMFAARAQHLKYVIKPALQAGKWILSDRFVDASYAYQGGGRQLDLKIIQQLDKWIVNATLPDLTILLDAPPEIGLARAKHRSSHDRIEQEKLDFFERVRDAYLQRAKQNPKRFQIIDATQPLVEVEQAIIKILTIKFASQGLKSS